MNILNISPINVADHDDPLNTAFCEDEEEPKNFIIINDSTCYAPYKNAAVIHNLNFQSAEKLMENLDQGSWVLWIYRDELSKIKLHAITIKTNEGLVHHKDFLYYNFEVLEISITKTFINGGDKLFIKKIYKNLEEYLDKLNKIYGLDKNKQVIYEDDNDFC